MKRFIVVHDGLLDKIEHLSDGASRFAFLLLRRAFYKNNVFRICKDLSELAAIAGRSERTVRRYLEELQSVSTISLSDKTGKYTLEFGDSEDNDTDVMAPSTPKQEDALFDDPAVDDATKLILSSAVNSVYSALDDGKLKKEKVVEEVMKKAKADIEDSNSINAVLNACLALIESKRTKVSTPIAFIKAALRSNYRPRKLVEMNAMTIIERNLNLGYATVREMLCSIGFSRLLDCRHFLHRRADPGNYEGIKAFA